MVKRWLKLPDKKSFLLLGSRRAGKTTLLKSSWPDATYITLDDYDNLDLAGKDPKELLTQPTKRIIIDEVQREPRLMIAAKNVIDNQGKFISLTGSSAIRLETSGVETLAGRIKVLECPTFCWGEPNGESFGSFLEVKSNPTKAKEASRSLGHWINYGGYPEVVVAKSDAERKEILKDYKNSFFLRELASLNDLENSKALLALMMMLARGIGSRLEISSLSKEVGLSVPTIKKYLRALESSRIIFSMTGFQFGFAKRLLKAPKYYFCDVGIPTALGVELSAGQRFELFVLSEIRKRLQIEGLPAEMFYYESVGGREIDLILEYQDLVVAIEVKGKKKPTGSDLKGLEEFEISEKKRLKKILYSETSEPRDVGSVSVRSVTDLYQSS